MIGDADLHYLAEGSHLRPFEVLGAHPVTEQSWAVARRWADEAMTALEPLPEGVVKESLANFALAVVDRTA